MKFLFLLFTDPPYFQLPAAWYGWLVWFAWIGLLSYILWRWRKYDIPLTRQHLPRLGVLVLAAIVAALFVGFRLPSPGALPPPGIPVAPADPVLAVFASVPWFLAAGFFGPTVAAALAFIPGLTAGLWGTHNPFFPLELVFLAATAGVFLRQRYRTPTYRLLAHPLVTALLLTLLYSFFYLFNVVFLYHGTFVELFDFALSHLSGVALAVGGSFLLGGLAAELVKLLRLRGWGGQGALLPSPAERSLKARFFYLMVPIGLVVMLLLAMGDWWVSARAARRMLSDRMSNAVGTAVESVPFFLEAGQDLIQQIAKDPRLTGVPASELESVLTENLRTVPFFSKLFYFDSAGSLVASFPPTAYDLATAPLDEQNGVRLAINGVGIQSYALPPLNGMSAARVTFIANVRNTAGQISGALVGHIDLESNPFTQPILASLDSLNDVEGEGYLLDERGVILYHPESSLIWTEYSARAEPGVPFLDQTAADGTRSLTFFREAVGRPWTAAVWVPARQAQQLSLQFALPLLVMITIIGFLSLVLASLGINLVTTSLQNLAVEADRIAQGNLDRPLSLEGHDEVAQLRRSFETMRLSLRTRLEELNRLLVVSQGVAATLDLEASLTPVLEAASAMGASSARIVLDPAAFPEVDMRLSGLPTHYAAGPAADRFVYLDDQILALAREQERIVLTNPGRVRSLRMPESDPRPQAILSLGLRHENTYFGTFWLGYDHPHAFTEEETRFFVTLGSQAALAAANAHLFMNAEVGRQRLAAILESTPDPVLVTDSQNRIGLINHAAQQVLGLSAEFLTGQPVYRAIAQSELVELLRNTAVDSQAAEITLPDSRTFLAIASSTMMNGQRMGRVCIMRDVTQFKTLDALKSEFVSTVSHDLRSPLTLIHGYATMIQNAGDLNDQQANYARKIMAGIDRMNHLVNNLLDLGRIEAGVDLQLELVSIREVVDQVMNGVGSSAVQKQIEQIVRFPDGSEPVVEADKALLQQALTNLVENAIKYTDIGGRVEVAFETRQENAVLKVSDTGIGIAPVDQSRLFEKFYRVQRRGPLQPRGTGLGLAIVKSIAERHGGRVWVESQLGRGSAFFFLIPLRQNRSVPPKK